MPTVRERLHAYLNRSYDDNWLLEMLLRAIVDELDPVEETAGKNSDWLSECETRWRFCSTETQTCKWANDYADRLIAAAKNGR